MNLRLGRPTEGGRLLKVYPADGRHWTVAEYATEKGVKNQTAYYRLRRIAAGNPVKNTSYKKRGGKPK